MLPTCPKGLQNSRLATLGRAQVCTSSKRACPEGADTRPQHSGLATLGVTHAANLAAAMPPLCIVQSEEVCGTTKHTLLVDGSQVHAVTKHECSLHALK